MLTRGAATRTSRVAGFTLVEVLLALFLIAIAILAAAPMFMYALRGSANSADLGSAGALAVARMEVLRTQDFTTLVDGGSLTASVAGYVDDSHEGFEIRWEISSATAPGESKQISVRAVSTRQSGSIPKQVTLTTLRAR